ncbi:UDP-xylose and UDP-N-acetylglucosamine transporter isoform X1 [Fukomys damarensis]|uniref:UDP-xylose and UDP-N-acetylglucosamine transporter isoform X1 n=1 Tax=Fukomys damarensis TaxID=885580 RepID=UPI00053F53C1|nr:UDP-xylose and UDP-N-acetylglucosamine transporter isoform X1 [Fukomys damarensis]
MRPAFAVGLVFAGCCSNVIFLELLARKHPGCGNIVTFAQFLFIAVEGFLFEADLGRKPPAIPISVCIKSSASADQHFQLSSVLWAATWNRYYAVMVTMFFTVSVVNNYALNLNIAMPLHMIFRSGSLIANMILGIIILKKRYSIFKYTSIALVSVGIFICTFMSAKQVTSQSSMSENDGFQAFAWWLLGIGALTFALLMSARMGIFQETLYKQFGKHSKEALFYNHALPLPGFIFLASDIYDHAVLFNKSELYQLPVIGVTIPIMWFYLLVNVITQYVCVRGVFMLTTECASLTVTLVVTLRKFVSLIFSILYFQNPFTLWHWLGTLFVFIGTLMYTEVWNNIGTTWSQPQKDDKKN